MKKVVFITGNSHKARYLQDFLGFPVEHRQLDLDEIQFLDLREIVEHKVKQAYNLIKSLVLVEDVSLEFACLNSLPGPFIKFFVDNISFEEICSLAEGKSRNATARCVFGYFDGTVLEFFEGSLAGEIASSPQGDNGFGWDKIFIPEGYSVTRASLGEEDNKLTYMKIKPFEKVKTFLEAQE